MKGSFDIPCQSWGLPRLTGSQPQKGKPLPFHDFEQPLGRYPNGKPSALRAVAPAGTTVQAQLRRLSVMKNLSRVSNFGSFARRGLLPLSDTQRPTTLDGQAVANGLKAYLRATAEQLDKTEQDRTWRNLEAKTSNATRILEGVRRQIEQHRDSAFRTFDSEARKLEDLLAQKRDAFERSWGALAASRIHRRAEEIAARRLPAGELQQQIEAAVLKRDAEGLAVFYAAGVDGAESALARYLVGDPTAAKTEQLKRDRISLQLMFDCALQGIDELQSAPEEATSLNLRPSPDLLLAASHAGPEAILGTQQQPTPTPTENATAGGQP